MSKEKTRAELHAEIKELKEYIETRGAAYEALMKDDKELGEKCATLEAERDEYRKESIEWQTKWDKLYKEKERETERLKDERDTAKVELNCEREAWEKKEQGFQKIIADMGKYEDELKADLDKAQYIAADLLEHGVFHFLIVKYRNLRAK